MHINPIHIIIAIVIGAVAALARGKNKRINLTRSLVVVAIGVLIIIVADSIWL
jgi:asparagine N-glycosylation enzyme membrane subunit Stt3